MPTNRDGRMLIWIGICAVCVVIAGLSGYVYFKGKVANTSIQLAVNSEASIYPQFPRSLILDNTVVANGNYSVTSDGANRYTATWKSSASGAALDAQYKNYLLSLGWEGAEVPLRDPTTHQILAATTTSTVAVTIKNSGGASTVTITYVTH